MGSALKNTFSFNKRLKNVAESFQKLGDANKKDPVKELEDREAIERQEAADAEKLRAAKEMVEKNTSKGRRGTIRAGNSGASRASNAASVLSDRNSMQTLLGE